MEKMEIKKQNPSQINDHVLRLEKYLFVISCHTTAQHKMVSSLYH